MTLYPISGKTLGEMMIQPLIELFIAGALWGFSFTATTWALKTLDAPAIMFYRFVGAGLFGLVPLLLWRRKNLWRKIREEGKTAWKPGLWLFLTILFQTFGLISTTATKSAFITTLYVVLTPFLAQLTGQDRLLWRHFLWVALALVGLGLFQNLQFDNWNWGDTLTVIAAIMATMHILSVAKYAPKSKSPYLMTLWQMFWTGFLSLLLFPMADRFDPFALDFNGALGMFVLIFGAGLLAFYFQVRAQEKIPPNLASLLFLLESPFSALFAIWLLHEHLEPLQWVGGGIILASCGLAILTERPSHDAR